jgi:N-acetylglucosaminyldiphosphoundecaprenol N-acetyl-beta-D-mannosaminyltransferase
MTSSRGISSTRISIGGVNFVVTDLEAAVDAVIGMSLSRHRVGGVPIHFSNAYSVAIAARDPQYRATLNSFGLTFPDGKPIVWSMRSRFFGKASRARQIRGHNFFTTTLDKGRTHGLRHYFFGSSADTLAALSHELGNRFSGAQLVGSHAPEFSEDPAELANQLPISVSRENVDLLWIALGTPKQDHVANAIAARTGLVVLAVGAAFDFSAGLVKEAPVSVQRMGLEWAYRLWREPRRLWRRYLVGNIGFLVALITRRGSRNGEVAL